MSDQWSKCSPCAGSECLVCSGSGFDGDALAYYNAQNREEWERDVKEINRGWTGFHSVSWSRYLKEERSFMRGGPKMGSPARKALDAAILAFEKYVNKQKQKEKDAMNTQLTQHNGNNLTLAQRFGYSEKQLDLVKRTVAKNATDDELELFFYRCKELGLNPLMPGQVYFLKFKNRKTGEWNPGTVIVGLDGFRARANRTGKLNGIKRGVIRNAQGHCIGGWADVYRKDWEHPAHEEVPLSEYSDPYKDTWKDMPETMIKKVAEVAALRMAFPDDLGGLYLKEEMDQADRESEPRQVQAEVVSPAKSNGPRKPTDAQLKRLFAIAKSNGLTNEELKEVLMKDYGYESSKDLTLEEYNELCERLEAKTIQTANQELQGTPMAVVESSDVWSPEELKTDERYVK